MNFFFYTQENLTNVSFCSVKKSAETFVFILLLKTTNKECKILFFLPVSNQFLSCTTCYQKFYSLNSNCQNNRLRVKSLMCCSVVLIMPTFWTVPMFLDKLLISFIFFLSVFLQKSPCVIYVIHHNRNYFFKKMCNFEKRDYKNCIIKKGELENSKAL